MKPAHRAKLDQLEIGIRMARTQFDRFGRRSPVNAPVVTTPAAISEDQVGADIAREFQRRMAAIIEAVQTAIWQRGVHELLGYTTDYAIGQQRGVQTLVLKTRRRSAYVRLQWDTVMGDSVEDRQRMYEVVQSAIQELA